MTEGGRLTSLTTPVETWMSVFHVNFLAPILLARGLFDELKDGVGTVVNVTSIVGSRVHPFAGTAYATSKAALGCLTREMAHDFAPHGIRVNAIAPGEIKTDILSPETEALLAPVIPMRRIGTPDEVAKVIYLPVLGCGELCDGRRNQDQRRTARLNLERAGEVNGTHDCGCC